MLAEYHDLYELQRKRLEFVVAQLTNEKELWSVAAYCLALKVTPPFYLSHPIPPICSCICKCILHKNIACMYMYLYIVYCIYYIVYCILYIVYIKVTEEKNLQTAKRLQLCEKSWQKLANHFTILLSNQDTGVLTVLQGHVDQWRDLIENFNFNMKRREEEMRERLSHLLEDIEDFRSEFSSTHL